MDAFFGKDKVSDDELVLPALVYELVVHASKNHDAEQRVIFIRRQRSVELGSDSPNHGTVICAYDEERGTTIEESLSYLELHSFTRFLCKSLTMQKSERPVDRLGYCNEQRFHVLRVLNKVVLRHDIDQGTNGKVSSVLWT